jgi:aryl-alcohol dehydrogenase-like predicted oxidoreductase
VLVRAARLCKVPIWKLEPEQPWKPPAEPKQPDPPIALPTITPVRPRQLGRGGPVVSPLGVFLIFWTQSWPRVTDDVRDALERLKAEGKVRVYGLSTHSRQLAAEAIRQGWDPVMVRHSAAHRKAEAEVFPVARERGTSVITFNNTCYGRLLDPGEGGEPAFRPSDCFRFTLNTPGGSACFTAPATLEQLDENLDALWNPELADDVRERLIRRGEWLYREDMVFRRTVRAGR